MLMALPQFQLGFSPGLPHDTGESAGDIELKHRGRREVLDTIVKL